MTVIAPALLLATLAWGPHPVGFAVGYARDAEQSRTFHGKPRPIQMSFWYPAARYEAGRMTFRDYLKLKAGERSTTAAEGERDAVVEEYASFLRNSAKMTQPDVDRWLDRQMRAIAGAPPLDGPFALVLVAQGSGHGAADQALLCEVLASHGFTVATSPSPTRIDGPMRSDADVPRVARAQAFDLEAIAQMGRTMAHVDQRKTAIVAHSFGARSALLFAMHHRVAGLVSLDGGIGTKRGTRELKSSPLFDACERRGPSSTSTRISTGTWRRISPCSVHSRAQAAGSSTRRICTTSTSPA
jgi:hypothetical protein